MKKQGLSLATNLLSLLALFLLFSSFTYLSHATAVAETKQSFWAALQGFSFQKLGFWQKTALLLGASSLSYAVVHRHFRRHYDGEGVGCLGVLGIIILGALVIALLPVILVVGLFMLIFGIPIPRFSRRHGRRYEEPHSRRRHYRRDWD